MRHYFEYCWRMETLYGLYPFDISRGTYPYNWVKP